MNDIMHMPEEALDIQSELIFVNGMPRNVNLQHKNLILKFYFRSSSKVAVNFVFLKPTNKAFTYA